MKRAEAKEHSAEPGLAHAIVIAADKLLHPVRNTHVQQEQPHAGSAMHVADKTAFSGKWRGESQLQQPHTESSTHVADRSALPSEQTGESQPKTAGQLSPVTLQRVEKHLGERDLAGAKIGDPAAALKKAAGVIETFLSVIWSVCNLLSLLRYKLPLPKEARCFCRQAAKILPRAEIATSQQRLGRP